jgi:hypothetical protein
MIKTNPTALLGIKILKKEKRQRQTCVYQQLQQVSQQQLQQQMQPKVTDQKLYIHIAKRKFILEIDVSRK